MSPKKPTTMPPPTVPPQTARNANPHNNHMNTDHKRQPHPLLQFYNNLPHPGRKSELDTFTLDHMTIKSSFGRSHIPSPHRCLLR